MQTYIESAVAVVDVNLSFAVPKKDHLAVWGPLDMGQLHPLKLLTPDPIAIHRPYNHRSWDGGRTQECAYTCRLIVLNLKAAYHDINFVKTDIRIIELLFIYYINITPMFLFVAASVKVINTYNFLLNSQLKVEEAVQATE